MTTVVDKISKENMKEDGLAPFGVGDVIKVHSKVREGEKERIQIFAGTVIAREGGGSSETFTVRRVSHGVGVEKVFPIHAPSVTKVEIERSSHVRRAKLYYLRDRSGKGARLREKIRK